MKILRVITAGTLLTLTCGWSLLHGKYKEADYANEWAEKHSGVQEYVLDDRTRVDILTHDLAIEVDYAPKWAEAVGQALYYAARTGRKPAVLLIVRTGDQRYTDRIHAVSDYIGREILVLEIQHK